MVTTISTLAGLQALSPLSSLDALHAPDTARASTLGAPAAPDFSAHALDSGAHAVLTPLDADTFVSSRACAHSASAADAIGTAGTRSLGALAVDAALRPASVGALAVDAALRPTSVFYSLQRGNVFSEFSRRRTTFQI